jgi:hypothetical protein
MYEIPSGNDQFELEVSPPFGEENIVVYASTSSLGELSTATRGGVFKVKTKAEDIGVKTRGLKIAQKDEKTAGSQNAAEFFEGSINVATEK